MNKADVIRIAGFLEGKTSKDVSFTSTGTCLISSGKTIARWNDARDELIFPTSSCSSPLSKQDTRRRQLAQEMAEAKGVKVILMG